MIPPAPGFAVSIGETYYEGSIGGSTTVPVKNLTLGIDLKVSFTPVSLLYIWNTSGSQWKLRVRRNPSDHLARGHGECDSRSSPGEPDIIGKCLKGYAANGKTYKVHLDGYDQSKFLTTVSGSAANNNGTKSARNYYFYSNDDGLLVAMRQGDYKYVFSEQRKDGTMGLWAEPFTTLRLQKIFNVMQDPFERADFTSNTFWDWQINHVGSMYGVMEEVFKFAATFADYPPRSVPPSFNPANVMEETLRMIKARQKLETAFPMLKDEPKDEKK